MDWLVLTRSTVALRSEHVITELNIRCVFKVQGDSLNDCRVDCDVAIALVFTSVLSLLLQNSEVISEHTLIIDKMTEAENSQIANP